MMAEQMVGSLAALLGDKSASSMVETRDFLLVVNLVVNLEDPMI